MASNDTQHATRSASQLTLLPDVDPQEVAGVLSRLPDDQHVRAVMNRLNPADAARVVAHAPGIDAQTRLMWSMEKPQRAAVLDHLAPVTVAAIIQNRERRNRRILGDLSFEHFAGILAFCSPKQRYYWISLANSFADAGANLLVLILTPAEVGESLLTAPEFRRKLPRLRLWVAGGFESAPPVDDERLRALLARLAEYDPERFDEVLAAATRLLDEEDAAAEWAGEMSEEPVELPRVPEVPPLVRRGAPPAGSPEEEAPVGPLVPVPAPHVADSLMRAAASQLTPARRRSLEREMEQAFREEVIAGGGSVSTPDIHRAAGRVQAALRLGLQGVPEEPDEIAAVLEEIPLRDILERGAVVLEQLRQIALRLRPFQAMLDTRQRDLIAALLHPQTGVTPDAGSPALMVPQTDRRRRPEAVPVSRLQEELAGISVWVAVARAIGLRALSEKLAEAANGSQAVLAALAVSLVAYGQWDPRALESAALRQFRDAHFDAGAGRWRAGLPEQVQKAVAAWTAQAGIEPAMRPRVVERVLDAMARLEEFLRDRRVVAWDRFAPGKRPSRRRPPHVSLDDPDAQMDDDVAEG